MRVFGSTKQEVTIAYITEFVVIGFIAALVAVIVSNSLAYYLSIHILNIPFKVNGLTVCLNLILASILVPFAAWFGLRRYLFVTPRSLLQSI